MENLQIQVGVNYLMDKKKFSGFCITFGDKTVWECCTLTVMWLWL